MRSYAGLCLCLFSYFVSAQVSWVQVWGDEFNYTGLPDSTKWSYDVGGNGFGNQEEQYYTDADADNAHVDNGMLTITAMPENFGGNDYTSAKLISRDKGDWKYGKIEVRAKIPTGRGSWPAIWMMPTDGVYGGWPNSGEIDIMENVGYDPDKIHWNTHTEAFNHTMGNNYGTSETYVAPYDNFYTYGIEWFEDSLVFVVDDVTKYVFHNQHLTSAEWPFDQRFYLIMNIAVGGTWGGAQGIDNAIFPLTMEVDYVRVYKQTDPNATHYELTLSSNEGGDATSSSVVGQVVKDENVTLTATPDSDYEFVKWEGTYSSSENPISFAMQVDTDMKAVFAKKGELIINGDFAAGGSNWWWNPGSHSQVSVGGGINYNISQQSTNPWDVQLVQGELDLKDGHVYEYSFEVSSNMASSFITSVGLNETPWTTYFQTVVQVTDQPTTYSYQFTMNGDDPAGRVAFDLGDAMGDITISNISLIDLSSIVGNKEDYEDDNNSLDLYPNPVSSELHVGDHFDLIDLFNAKGERVASFQSTSTIDVLKYDQGTYTVRCSNLTGEVKEGKVQILR